jgi:hypothetical protein
MMGAVMGNNQMGENQINLFQQEKQRRGRWDMEDI